MAKGPDRKSDGRRVGPDGGGKNDTGRGLPLLVEVISEGPHCIPCEYTIATVQYVAENFGDRIRVSIVETKYRQGAERHLELCRTHGKQVPVPSILFDGRLAFAQNPGPDELQEAIDRALAAKEASR